MMEINLKPTNKQFEALSYLRDNTTSFVVFGGGGGGGKSWLGCEWLMMMAIAYPNTRWFIGRKQLSNLMASTYLTWIKVCKYHNFEDFTLNGQQHFIQLGNGSRIDLVDLKYNPSDPLYEDLGSYEFTGGFIEEAGEIDFKAFDVLKTRIGRHLNKEYNLPAKIFITCNPKKNWLYELVYKPAKTGTLSKEFAFIQSLYKDNPHTASDYEKMLSSITDKVLKERLMFGNWEYDDDSVSLMKYDNILDLFTNTVTTTVSTPKYIVADVARYGSDRTVISLWKGLLCEKIITKEKQGVDVTANDIKELAKQEFVPFSNILIDDDGIGCLTKGTEVFTNIGWMKVEDLKSGDIVYSKNKEGIVFESNVTNNTVKEKTDIIKLKSGIEFSHAHFLPVKTRKEYPFKLHSWDTITESKSPRLTDSSFKWNGFDEPITLNATEKIMPYGGSCFLDNELDISTYDFARLLGWFIAEGCFNGRYVNITQSSKSIHNDEIRECIKNCGFNHTEKISKTGEIHYSIGHKAFQSWLLEHCYVGGHTAPYKKVPDIIKNATKKTIDAFLETYNHGDGYIHRNEREYVTTSKALADDIYGLILKIGRIPSIYTKTKAGSTSSIFGRKITRRFDVYNITELKGNTFGINTEIDKVYEDNVYNLEIEGDTRLYMVRFPNVKPFWVHNGGVTDILRGTKGFNGGSSAIEINMTQTQYQQGAGVVKFIKENYKNLKTQCSYKLAEYVNNHKIAIRLEGKDKELLIAELEQIKRKDPDKEGRLEIESKDKIKEILGRSPDIADAIMMRMFFELHPVEEVTGHDMVAIFRAREANTRNQAR